VARYDWISATEDWNSRIAAVNCSGFIAADAEEDTMAVKDPWEPEISDIICYVATGDRERWIGIEGAAADGMNSTRRYCS